MRTDSFDATTPSPPGNKNALNSNRFPTGAASTNHPAPNPPAAKVPIILGSMRPRALKLAGAKADGIAINLIPANALSHVLAPVHEGAREAGRPVEELEVVQRVFVALGSPEEAERAARRWVIAYAQVEVYRTFFHAIGVGESLDDLRPFDADSFARALLGLGAVD